MAHYPGFSRWTQYTHRDLKVERGRQKRSESEKQMWELDLPLLALKMEEEGHESGNVGDLYQLEKARKWVLP